MTDGSSPTSNIAVARWWARVERVEGDGRRRPGVMSGLDVDRHAAEVAMGDRRYPASHGQSAGDVVREAEHHAPLQGLAER